MSSSSAIQDTYPYQNDPKWSKSEKAITRTAFDAALKQEFHQVIQEAKQKANQIKEPRGSVGFGAVLSERRKEIDRRYDYRYSQLAHVFERLLQEGQQRDEELHGLREDKLKPIRSFAKFLAEDTAA